MASIAVDKVVNRDFGKILVGYRQNLVSISAINLTPPKNAKPPYTALMQLEKVP